MRPGDAEILHFRAYWRNYFRNTPPDRELMRVSSDWEHHPTRHLKQAMQTVACADNHPANFEILARRVTEELQRLVALDRRTKELEAQATLRAAQLKAAADAERRRAELAEAAKRLEAQRQADQIREAERLRRQLEHQEREQREREEAERREQQRIAAIKELIRRRAEKAQEDAMVEAWIEELNARGYALLAEREKEN